MSTLGAPYPYRSVWPGFQPDDFDLYSTLDSSYYQPWIDGYPHLDFVDTGPELADALGGPNAFDAITYDPEFARRGEQIHFIEIGDQEIVLILDDNPYKDLELGGLGGIFGAIFKVFKKVGGWIAKGVKKIFVRKKSNGETDPNAWQTKLLKWMKGQAVGTWVRDTKCGICFQVVKRADGGLSLVEKDCPIGPAVLISSDKIPGWQSPVSCPSIPLIPTPGTPYGSSTWGQISAFFARNKFYFLAGGGVLAAAVVLKNLRGGRRRRR